MKKRKDNMSKGIIMIILSLVLAFLPQIIGQFYLGISFALQYALLLIFPILGLFLGIKSLNKINKKSTWRWGSGIVILINAIVIIVISIVVILSI